jgi:elongator complex protein 4
VKGTFHAQSPESSPATSQVDRHPERGLASFLDVVDQSLRSTAHDSVHRIVVPSLLSPMLYLTSTHSQPCHVLSFLHSLRALLRRHSKRLTAVLSLQSSLYPRTSGLARWIEILSDGVIELIPMEGGESLARSTGKPDKPGSMQTEKAQGLVRVYTLPIYHEKGGGGAEGNYFRQNLSFAMSSSRGLVISPYSLPPLADDDHKEKSPASTVKDGIDF